jgi:hypothetical protein
MFKDRVDGDATELVCFWGRQGPMAEQPDRP